MVIAPAIPKWREKPGLERQDSGTQREVIQAMPLQRLRRVLGGTYRVTVESSPDLVTKVNRKKARRRADLLAKQAQVPGSKNAAVVDALEGTREWTVRAIDLLRKIGYLTTPSWVNMAQLSASWATRRYFWAIADPGQAAPAVSDFRLSSDARAMDFHQKTLLSDEFGIGIAGLLVESFFQTDSFSDVSVALGDPAMFQNIVQQGEAQPDYLMWAEPGNAPYYLVECKGSQSDRNTSYDQLRRGLEQVRTIHLGPGPRELLTLVIATCLLDDTTEVLVLDPPTEEDGKLKDKKSKPTSSEREFRVKDRKIFHQRAVIAQESQLLKWAGQYRTASAQDAKLGRTAPEGTALVDVPLETKETDFGEFRGRSQPLFPELGGRNLRIFTGVEAELLEAIRREPGDVRPEDVEGIKPRRYIARAPHERLPGNISVGSDGSCMIVDGL
jgi:hypothetical protein